ncbi:MAG: glycosyltransferase family 39 protein [Victivallaceae bacterium]|nr:glycosyltransferase family 39 protein [Victivallaceae bacterium]
MNNRKITLLIFTVGMIAFLAGLYSQEIIRINIRYAIFAFEMKQYGMQLFPTLYGKPYLDYFSPFIILTYITTWGGTWINMLTLTIPTAIAGALTLVVTYLIGEQVNKKLGLYAVLICLMTYTFFASVRTPSMDIFVTLFTALSFYLAYTAHKNGKWKHLLFIPLCFLASFAIRGPLGLVIPAAVVFSYYAVNHHWRQATATAIVTAIIGLTGMTAVLYLCAYSGGRELVTLFLDNQIFSRMGGHKPLWFFFSRGLHSYALALPLAFLVIICYAKKLIIKPLKADSAQLYLMRSLTAWLLIVFIGMSIPGDKHLRYILPIIPAAALLAAWIFVNFDNSILFAKLKKIFFLLTKIAPVAASLTCIGIIIASNLLHLNIRQLPLIIGCLLFIALAISTLKIPRKLKLEYYHLSLVASMTLSIIILQITVISVMEEYKESSVKFVTAVEQLRQGKPLYFFKLGPDGEELKYLVNLPYGKMFIPEFIIPPGKYGKTAGTKLPVRAKKQPSAILTWIRGEILAIVLNNVQEDRERTFPPFKPRYICYCDWDKLFSLPAGTVFITSKREFKRSITESLKIRLQIIATGKLGHKKCLAFTVK